MNYSEQLSQLSKAVLELDNSNDIKAKDILAEGFHGRIKVYQKNYLYVAIEAMEEDYVGTKKYLGVQNFKFFVRKMLRDRGIGSPNMVDFTKEFPRYLKSQYDIHQDLLLEGLAQIDHLWSYGEKESITIIKGLVLLWQELVEGKEQGESKIDLLSTETIQLKYIEEEKVFAIVR